MTALLPTWVGMKGECVGLDFVCGPALSFLPAVRSGLVVPFLLGAHLFIHSASLPFYKYQGSPVCHVLFQGLEMTVNHLTTAPLQELMC